MKHRTSFCLSGGTAGVGEDSGAGVAGVFGSEFGIGFTFWGKYSRGGWTTAGEPQRNVECRRDEAGREWDFRDRAREREEDEDRAMTRLEKSDSLGIESGHDNRRMFVRGG